MAAEIHGLLYRFDSAYIIMLTLQEILGREIDLEGQVDSQTLFNVVAKYASTLEKRLQIDVNSIRQRQDNGELKKLGWIPGHQNNADGLTKMLISKAHPLWKLITTNSIDINIKGWATENSFRKRKISQCQSP